MDETMALPSEKAVTLAMRTQQVLRHEILAGAPIDPLGGSYFVEWMTDRMEQGAEEYFRKIEAIGGVIVAIETGYLQREIAQAAVVYQQEIDRGDRIIVGVNKYQIENEEIEIPILKIAETEIQRVQSEKLAALRRRRDARRVQHCLDDIKSAAQQDRNVMPHLVEGAHACCTLGEMVNVLKEVYAEYEEPVAF